MKRQCLKPCIKPNGTPITCCMINEGVNNWECGGKKFSGKRYVQYPGRNHDAICNDLGTISTDSKERNWKGNNRKYPFGTTILA